MKKTLSLLGLALLVAGTSRGAFSPIALNPSSYNHDVVVEAAAPVSLNGAVNVTQDGGTNKNGNTFYERGYNTAAPTTGLPPAGSLVTNAALNHIFQMPPDYHVNNVVMVGHNNGGRTPLLNSGTLTLTTPGIFSGLSFLTCSGNGPVLVGYTIHYADSSTESGTFSSLDWFLNPPPASVIFNCAGRVSLGGGVQNVGANPAAEVIGADINVGNTAVNVVSIDLFYTGSGANNNPYNNGRACIFALSGAKDGSTDYTNTLAVTGFNYDAVVESDAAPTTGAGVAAGSILTNNITASMDGGTTKLNNTWYESGYYAGFAGTGLPVAGGTVVSPTLPATYTMPSSYVGNCAVALATNITTANVTPATPGIYGALSFLCATANGDTFLPATIQFADGSTEFQTVFVPDWFNREVPWAYLSFGRVNPNNRTLNSTPDQFVNPFATPIPGFDFRGLALPPTRLFDAVININNTSSAITNISLSFTNVTGSTRFAAIFALSGVPVGNIPPVFGARGTPTPGQPNNAPVNAISLLKRYEGTNNVVLSVTNIAGTGPISYQWKKAPRGGGLRDMMYTFDYTTFANVVDGGRISGATTSALVISNALVADSADYLLVASNAYGAITSTVATVMILTTNQSLLVGVPAGDVLAPIAGDGTPAAENTDHVIDQVAQKWLSSGLQQPPPCCGGVFPFTGPVGFTVTPVSGSSIVNSMRFFTANDACSRDPYDYFLEGSNDGGSTWTPITGGVLKGTLSLPGTAGSNTVGRNGTGATPVDALNQFVIEVDFANATGYRSYRVSITNNINRFGDALMQIAEIQLLGSLVPNPPVWVRQPDAAVTVFVGASPSFGVQASGYPLPKYQWYRNGTTLIPGGTGSSYTFPNAQLADSGTTFLCVASNNFASITSSPVTVTVIAAPTQPYPVAVLGNNPIGYWRLDEAEIGSGDNGEISHDYRGGHNGYYSNALLQVDGYTPAADSDKAGQFGTVNTVNSYVAEIKDVDFARGTNTGGATFSVEAWVNGNNQTVDTAIVTKGYNGILTAGTGTGTEQFVLDVSGGNPRKFRFLVRDAAGNGYVAQSTVTPFDAITAQPTWRHLVGVCDQANGRVQIYVDGLLAGTGAIGTNVGILAQPLPMTIGARKSGGATEYDNQWVGIIDEVAIYPAAINASQALAHFYAGQHAPIITLQPTNQTTPDNVTVTFNSAAYGPGTLSYQWYLSDGFVPTTGVAGQTSQNLSFVTTPAHNNNNYQLIVTNEYGGTTGAVAQLTVVSGPPSFLLDLPSSQTVLLGHVIQLHVVAGGTAPFTYQWEKDTVPISNNYRTSGAQTDTLTIGYAQFSDTASYRVKVTGVGSTYSTADLVTVTNSSSSAPPFTAAGTGWSLQGSTAPIMGDNRLELTSGLGNTARSAFMVNPIPVSSFNASFVYQDVSGAGGADGVTFCIQNAPAGAAALGGGGGALGYGTIAPSVALAMNIYDPNTRGIGFPLSGGALPAAGAGAFTPIAPVLVGGNANPIKVDINYSGGAMTCTFRDLVTLATFVTNKTVDVPGLAGGSTAFVGFTGADGGVVSTQVISNFTMTPPPVVLKGARVGDSLVLSWPATTGGFLKSTPSLTPPVVWSDVTAPFAVVGNEAQVTVSPLTGNLYYRLQVFP